MGEVRMLIYESFGEEDAVSEPSLKRGVKVNQRQGDLEEKKAFSVQKQRPGGETQRGIRLSSLLLLEPLCSQGRIHKLSWCEKERCALKTGLEHRVKS